MSFALRPAPHLTPTTSVPLVMRRVLYALVPATIVYTWHFGWGLLINIVIAVAAALAAEALMLRARRRPIRPGLADATAAVTAVLLAFAIPPLAPWWLPALGAGLAIVLAKHLYGGLGSNLFNPAMVGYAILLISFPVEMTQWLPPVGLDPSTPQLGFWANLNYAVTGHTPSGLGIDALTQATPLDQVKDGLGQMRTLDAIQVGPLFGSYGGRGWEWINGCFALGGLYLLYRGVIRWHIPASLLAGLLACAAAFHAVDPSRYLSPGFHLFSGATLLGAFFIATDPVTAAATDRGRLIFGAAIGAITYAIRTWGGYPDGLAFAVLLMNATVPVLDRYTRPRIYGQS
ncbi:MAG: electron transport complex subunit RsxD [Gammaproteobacteria bacterium]